MDLLLYTTTARRRRKRWDVPPSMVSAAIQTQVEQWRNAQWSAAQRASVLDALRKEKSADIFERIQREMKIPEWFGSEVDRQELGLANPIAIGRFLNDKQFPLEPFLTPLGPVKFSLYPSAELSKWAMRQCFDLIYLTSGDDYRASSVGWNPRDKQSEMRDSKMFYLLVRRYSENRDTVERGESDILGFLSFMPTFDDPPNQFRLVNYIYEIHLRESLRGCGLGTKLIKYVESLTRKTAAKKVMLTVFTRNERARKLYEKLGYTKDECSPDDKEVRRRVIPADYIIMSKELESDECRGKVHTSVAPGDRLGVVGCIMTDACGRVQ